MPGYVVPPRDIFILLAIACPLLDSAVLTSNSLAAGAGQTVSSSLTLATEGEQIAALQFDLDWDESLDVKPVIGEQARQIAKVLYGASLGPHSVRFLIAGLNREAMADGEILKLFLVVSPSAEPELHASG